MAKDTLLLVCSDPVEQNIVIRVENKKDLGEREVQTSLPEVSPVELSLREDVVVVEAAPRHPGCGLTHHGNHSEHQAVSCEDQSQTNQMS